MAVNDESVVAARRVTLTQLDDETGGRDEDRARRYVATVRPEKAALRYVYPAMAESGTRKNEGNKKTRQSETEEGGAGTEANSEQRAEEGGGSSVDTEAETTASSSVGRVTSTDEEVAEYVAKVRKAARQQKRRAKQRRVEAAKLRRRQSTVNEEVDVAVATLNSERRERQRDEARAAWERRLPRCKRTNTRGGDGGCAKARLVQRRQTEVGAMELGTWAEVGLPTTLMDVEGERWPVKWDSGARYSVAGTDWMMRGERTRRLAPVDVVEGIGGFLLDVIGVWTFEMRNSFGQTVTIEACIIDGCTDEFLVGVEFLKHDKAVLDFKRNEVRYDERKGKVVIPFRTEGSVV
ncbi:hypothetical protein PInf_013681 [Phytophthora infestans]|nr:hypothetical protein PInf_013681 [Phytophthora infestans]